MDEVNLHQLGFQRGLCDHAPHPEYTDNVYYMMAYRDGAEERRRATPDEPPRGERLTDWSAA